MYGVCRRYLKAAEDAEEVLVTGMYKAMTKMAQYSGAGSLEGWIRRVVVNEALMCLRAKQKMFETVELADWDHATEVTIESELAAKDLLRLVDALPTGYRTVFNLYVIEGYKHKEIAEMLGISINTSKSQLILAKQRLREEITKQQYNEAG